MVVIEFVCSADVMKQTIASETGFFKKSASSIESLATDFIHDCLTFCDKHFAQPNSFFLTYSSHSVDQALRELRSGPLNMIPFRGADSTLQKKILNDWLLANKHKADSAPRFLCVLSESWTMESTIEPIIEAPELLKGPVFISKIHGQNADCSSIEHPSLTLSGSVIGATELNYSLTQISTDILAEILPLGLSEAMDQSRSISADTDNTPAKPENRLVDLVLIDTGLSKIEAVRSLRKILSMELSDASATIESLPATVKTDVDKTIASDLLAKLESAGFSVNLVSTAPELSSSPPSPVQQSSTSGEVEHSGGAQRKVRIVGNMDWFRVAEQPDSPSALPAVFREMSDLSTRDPQGNQQKVVEALGGYVGGRFVADNLTGWKTYFNADTYGEFEATQVRVIGFDFSEQPLPSCKVEAIFDIPLKDGITVEEVMNWDETELQGDLYSAVTFYWDLDEIEELEDLDLTVGDHNGCEASIVA